MFTIHILSILAGLAATVLRVRGITISTAEEVEAVNGTDTRLKCTFRSSAPITPATVTVSWTFRPLETGREESVFYYHQQAYPPTEGRFFKRVEWVGDVGGGDASVMLRDVKFTYNGTFVCQVKNPPDVHGQAGEVRLRVVAIASYSEIAILAAAVGGGIVVVLLILSLVMMLRHCRRKRQTEEAERHQEGKYTSVCRSEEVVRLQVLEEKPEMESAEELNSEHSTKEAVTDEEENKSSVGCVKG